MNIEMSNFDLFRLILEKFGIEVKNENDIQGAWLVVEKMKSIGEITIRFHPETGGGPWKVVIFGLDGDLTYVKSFAPTAPLAICRAALKAVESE